MPRVKFLKDTIHPDYGLVKKGEVLKVPHEYLLDYQRSGIAEESDDDVSRPEPEHASQREVAPRVPGSIERSVGGEQGPPKGTTNRS